jgi:phosphoglycolate phosphatase
MILDWSGTLVDDLPAVWEATNFVLARAQRTELTLEQFRAEFCLPFTIFYDKHIPHIPLPRLEDWYDRRFKQVQDSVVPLPHAREFLEFCRARKLRTFLLSTIHPDHFAVQEAVTGFGKYLEQSYLRVRDKRKKIHEILKSNGLKPGETMFVGDMQHDIETARHGGIHSCGVLTGYNTLEQLRLARPDLIVEHLGELREVLVGNDLEIGRNVPSRASARRASSKSQVPGSKPPPSALRLPPSEFPTATVGALIFNRSGEVLMIRTHKWSDRWGIPGGKIKWGESSIAALRREIKEETNLSITDLEFVLVQDCIHSKEFYRDAHFILLNYTCRCVGEPRVKLNDEARDFRWLPPGRALKLDLNQPTRILLQAVVKKGKRKHVENQHR